MYISIIVRYLQFYFLNRQEMFDDRAWYLTARSTRAEDAGKLLAFAHFRFDMDYDDEVLYVYEIQLEDCVKRKGLGKFMMQVCVNCGN